MKCLSFDRLNQSPKDYARDKVWSQPLWTQQDLMNHIFCLFCLQRNVLINMCPVVSWCCLFNVVLDFNNLMSTLYYLIVQSRVEFTIIESWSQALVSFLVIWYLGARSVLDGTIAWIRSTSRSYLSMKNHYNLCIHVFIVIYKAFEGNHFKQVL